MGIDRQRPRKWAFVVVPAGAIILTAALLFAVQLNARPAPAPVAATVPAISAAVTPEPTSTVAQAAAPLASSPVPSPTASPATVTAASEPPALPAPVDGDVLAIVNGVVLTRSLLEQAQVVDTLMAGLMGQQPTAPPVLVEQLINGELVWQRVQGAGAELTAADVDAIVQTLLQAAGTDGQGLAAALAAAPLSRAAFDAYVGRLAAIDRFATTESTRLGVTTDAFLRQLQAAGRISIGPVGAAGLASAVPAPTATMPMATTAATPPPATPTPEAVRGTAQGQLAADFSLPALNGAAETLSLADLRGRPAVLAFWTTWCPYCLRQTPVLVAGHDRYAGESLQFVGVNVKEDETVVKPYVTDHSIPYPILLDLDGAVADQYAVSGYPTTYFLDAAGRIVAVHVGALSAEQLDAYVGQLFHS